MCFVKARKARQRSQLFVVKWTDILSDPSWLSGPVSAVQPATCVSVGWLVYEDDKKIVLADSRAMDGDWGGLTVIPVGVVVSRTRVSGRSPESFMKERRRNA